MELLQRLLNNPLNLDLILYPCSEHGFLACDPGITSAMELWASAGALEDWAERLLSSSRNSNYCNVELSPVWAVMAKQAQLLTSRYIIPTAANWKHARVSAACSRREVKRARGARWSAFPQSLSFTRISLFAFWQMFLLFWIKCSARYELWVDVRGGERKRRWWHPPLLSLWY